MDMQADSVAATKEAVSDEELIARYRDGGDTAAFETLVHRYERPIYRYLFRYLHNVELAEEAFQLTFWRVHLKNHLFMDGYRFRPWLYRIATGCAVDVLRKEQRHQSVSLDETHTDAETVTPALIEILQSKVPSPSAQLDKEERREWTRRAVAQLPDHLRSVVLLVYFEGLKYREASEVLGIPEGTVKSRMHHALLELNKAWMRNHASSEK
jgi:RNA polymerase sigma-70 factor (ECF subfamily)